MLNSWLRRLTRRRRISVAIHIPAQKSGIAARGIAPLLRSRNRRPPFEAPACWPDLLVPLTLRPDVPVTLLVRPADRIAPFAPLSRPDNGADAPAFSPVQADVIERTLVDTEYACEMPAVRLRPAGEPIDMNPPVPEDPNGPVTAETGPSIGPDRPAAGLPNPRDAMATGARDIPSTLNELGVLTCRDGRPELLGDLLRRVSGRTSRLIINGIQSEPRLASHQRLLVEASAELAAGARALTSHLGLRQCTFLVNGAHGLRRGPLRRLHRLGMHTLTVRTSFPGGDDALVLRRLFRQRGHRGQGSGILILPVDTVWRAGVALLRDRPVTEQAVTVAGDCLRPRGQRVYRLPIGLTIQGLMESLRRQDLLLRTPRVMVLGGPMTGTTVLDVARTVISQTTQAVLLMSQPPSLDSGGCIRCGWCVDGCPVGIDPIAILNALEAGRIRVLPRLATLRCIGCGVCSSVCPSHLPLAQAVGAARQLVERPAQGL